MRRESENGNLSLRERQAYQGRVIANRIASEQIRTRLDHASTPTQAVQPSLYRTKIILSWYEACSCSLGWPQANENLVSAAIQTTHELLVRQSEIVMLQLKKLMKPAQQRKACAATTKKSGAFFADDFDFQESP